MTVEHNLAFRIQASVIEAVFRDMIVIPQAYARLEGSDQTNQRPYANCFQFDTLDGALRYYLIVGGSYC